MDLVKHPGLVFKKLIKTFGITQDDAATALGVSRFTISQIINCHRAITPAMALRISKVFGTTPEYWMEMQCAFELSVERINPDLNLDALVPLTPKTE